MGSTNSKYVVIEPAASQDVVESNQHEAVSEYSPLDWMPVVAQLKSAILASTGEKEQAKDVQKNFAKRCAIISQIYSLAECIKGNPELAKQIQLEFLDNAARVASSTADGIPVVGHIKGGIHYALDDKEAGHQAMKSASRTSAVIASAAVGFVVAGPPGAIGAAVGGGVAVDSLTTAVESAVHKEFKANGIYAPVKNPKNVDAWLGAGLHLAGDAFVGHGVAKVGNVVKVRQQAAAAAVAEGSPAAKIVAPPPAEILGSSAAEPATGGVSTVVAGGAAPAEIGAAGTVAEAGTAGAAVEVGAAGTVTEFGAGGAVAEAGATGTVAEAGAGVAEAVTNAPVFPKLKATSSFTVKAGKIMEAIHLVDRLTTISTLAWPVLKPHLIDYLDYLRDEFRRGNKCDARHMWVEILCRLLKSEEKKLPIGCRRSTDHELKEIAQEILQTSENIQARATPNSNPAEIIELGRSEIEAIINRRVDERVGELLNPLASALIETSPDVDVPDESEKMME